MAWKRQPIPGFCNTLAKQRVENPAGRYLAPIHAERGRRAGLSPTPPPATRGAAGG
jgi:hypothetical protein